MKRFRIQKIGATALLVPALYAAISSELSAGEPPNPRIKGAAQAETRESRSIDTQSKRIFLSSPQFLIPFQVAPNGTQPSAVLLYVSVDQGETWQLYGKTSPEAKHFEFRAAAEGDYLFSVKTVDSNGNAFSSPAPPIKVQVDTTQPKIDIQADLSPKGDLIISLQAADANLDNQSAVVRIRTDRDSDWRQIPIDHLKPVGDVYQGQAEISLPPCREILIVATVSDHAKNSAEATHHLKMPRTAVGSNDHQLASSRGSASLPGAIPWEINAEDRPKNETVESLPKNDSGQISRSELRENFSTSPFQPQKSTESGPGRLTSRKSELNLEPSGPSGILPMAIEELELPEPIDDSIVDQQSGSSVTRGSPAIESATAYEHDSVETSQGNRDTESQNFSDPLDGSPQSAENPYYSKTRTFSLDYSVESLGETALSSVELWGTEDQGVSWQKWGVDPDRVSPFDVKVGDDGLFGFRMVIVGEGGVVLGQPTAGDPADVWICVDTEAPTCRITRAVSGEGTHAGTLVIDYTCADDHLVEFPISLYYSDRPHGPWTSIASGLKNSGLHLWKVNANIPAQVYLKLEAVDKAGNVGTHRLDLPIDIRGVTPRGRIQGFRPIYSAE